ncbi:MAG: phosphonopyruvate decarboxylase, partial [Oscillospiraceae bacterium]|nr:phosphonopyruvate decarboxylase [Oscillospiraceae bacterium]
MHVKTFLDILAADFYAGVPDSQLRPLCDCLMDAYGLDPRRHIIAASEGTAAALAAGYHLATGRVPVVYLQNSGEGNLVNPAASLLHREVYGIPVILIVGWRGQPGVRDEPQHIFQGKITEKLLHLLDISTFAVKKDTTEAEILAQMEVFRQTLRQGG